MTDGLSGLKRMMINLQLDVSVLRCLIMSVCSCLLLK